ncbi:MAG: hypothetical protein L0H25_11055, partial [Micrococcales bacterium]|nr:hypothetical protein [Micrococcales bacterium]
MTSPIDDEPGGRGQGALRLPLSPLTDDRIRPIAVGSTVVVAIALLVAVPLSLGAGLVVTGVIVLVFAATWPALAGSRTPDASGVVLAIAGVVIVAAAVREDLLWGAGGVALGIIASFLQQLSRPDGREGLVLSLLAACGGLCVVTSGTLLAALGHRADARGIVVVTTVAVIGSVVGDLLLPVAWLRPFLGLVVLVVAVGAALAVRTQVEGVTLTEAIGIAAAAGTLSWSFRRVLALEPAMLGVRGQFAAGAGSVLAVGALAYL